MQIRHLDKSKMRPAHAGTILAQLGFRSDEIAAPFGTAWGYLKPGMQQAPESIPQSKLYFIVEGEAIMQIEQETETLTAGDLLHIPAHSMHSIRNPGPGDLVTFAIWWQPLEDKS